MRVSGAYIYQGGAVHTAVFAADLMMLQADHPTGQTACMHRPVQIA